MKLPTISDFKKFYMSTKLNVQNSNLFKYILKSSKQINSLEKRQPPHNNIFA